MGVLLNSIYMWFQVFQDNQFTKDPEILKNLPGFSTLFFD